VDDDNLSPQGCLLVAILLFLTGSVALVIVGELFNRGYLP
jgi:hypothetical protein